MNFTGKSVTQNPHSAFLKTLIKHLAWTPPVLHTAHHWAASGPQDAVTHAPCRVPSPGTSLPLCLRTCLFWVRPTRSATVLCPPVSGFLPFACSHGASLSSQVLEYPPCVRGITLRCTHIVAYGLPAPLVGYSHPRAV